MKPQPMIYQVESPISYLVVCDGGNVRSAALATTLKLNYGREAIAIGRLFVKPETMSLLCTWADRIVITRPHMLESIPETYRSKVISVDLGEDTYGINIHPTLNTLVDGAAAILVGQEKTP